MISPKTILLVDDDAMLRTGLKMMLQEKGYRTLEADDGLTARDVIDEKRPDLVILDMMMPHWGGFAVLEHYQNNPPAPPFIMLSGNDGAKHKAYVKQIGVADFLHKPCSMERLLASIERLFAAPAEAALVGAPSISAAPSAVSGRILLVDVHKPLLRALKHGLEDEGFTVECIENGALADRKARTESYDIILLDLMSATSDGLTLLRDWRRDGLSSHILALTARNTTADKVEGLNLGADDCMARPFQLPELLARARALLRRRSKDQEAVVRIGDLEIDGNSRTVKRAGQPIMLTPREFSLLRFLAAHRGKVVTRSMIWQHFYEGENERTSNVIDVYVRYLRNKIDHPFDKKMIQTRWGEGYLLSGE